MKLAAEQSCSNTLASTRALTILTLQIIGSGDPWSLKSVSVALRIGPELNIGHRSVHELEDVSSGTRPHP